MEYTTRGPAIIINNEHFEKNSPRTGSTYDVINLENLFRQLGFAPSIYRDLTAEVSMLNTP